MIKNMTFADQKDERPAVCVPFSSCSPFMQMMANLRKPLHRSGFILIDYHLIEQLEENEDDENKNLKLSISLHKSPLSSVLPISAGRRTTILVERKFQRQGLVGFSMCSIIIIMAALPLVSISVGNPTHYHAWI